jgi:hypothetical protein
VRLLYKPFGIIAGVLAGMIAGAIFKRVWEGIAGERDDAPGAMEKGRTWPEVIVAGAVRGAVFGGVRAAVDRAGATGFERLTGVWPGKARRAKRQP